MLHNVVCLSQPAITLIRGPSMWESLTLTNVVCYVYKTWPPCCCLLFIRLLHNNNRSHKKNGVSFSFSLNLVVVVGCRLSGCHGSATKWREEELQPRSPGVAGWRASLYQPGWHATCQPFSPAPPTSRQKKKTRKKITLHLLLLLLLLPCQLLLLFKRQTTFV